MGVRFPITAVKYIQEIQLRKTFKTYNWEIQLRNVFEKYMYSVEKYNYKRATSEQIQESECREMREIHL